MNDEDEEDESDGEVVFKSKLDLTFIFSEILESFALIILFGGCFVGGR